MWHRSPRIHVRRGPGRPGNTLALTALALAAFVIGTSELVVVGLLGPLARDVGVSISTAGELVTAYALGIAIGGPIVTALTGRAHRRLMLYLSLAAFVGGNLLTALAASFGMVLAARVATGTIQGLFIGVASVVAAGLAGPGHEGRAISLVFGGIAVSTVFGVPLGTLAGQAFGWRAAFVGIVILGAGALALALAVVPPVPARGSGRLADEARPALAPRVLALLGVGFLVIGGQFTALTYLAPFLERVTGVSGGLISAFLLAFGVASTAGTFVGGRAADRSAAATLIAANALLVVALGALFLVGAMPALVVVALAGWGLLGFGLVPALQLRVISLAGPGGDLAATLGASAVNAGIACGALVGGLVVGGPGVRYVAVAAAAICLLALPATLATRWLRPPAPGDGGTTPPRAATDVGSA